MLLHTVVRERAGGVRPDNRPVAVRGERVIATRTGRPACGRTSLEVCVRVGQPGAVAEQQQPVRVRQLHLETFLSVDYAATANLVRHGFAIAVVPRLAWPADTRAWPGCRCAPRREAPRLTSSLPSGNESNLSFR